MSSYWINSILIFASGEREIAAKAPFDMRRVAGHGLFEQKSTTITSIVPPLHGLLLPLKHLSLYRLPQAAPLSHNPSLTATKKLSGGNWSCLLPLHFVAEKLKINTLVKASFTWLSQNGSTFVLKRNSKCSNGWVHYQIVRLTVTQTCTLIRRRLCIWVFLY